MKAKIKATGEIAEFITGKNLQGEIILLKVGTASIFSLNEVEPITDTDWQQVRIQAAIAAMNGYQSAPIIPGCDPNPSQQEIAKWSVQLADALVAELQKKGGEQ